MLFDWYWFFLFFILSLHVFWSVYTIFVHRGILHGSITFSKPLETVFRILLWIFQFHWIGWRRTFSLHHRLHHMYPDTDKDPHSPRHFTLNQQINITDTSKPGSPYYIPIEYAKAHPEIYDFEDALEKFLLKNTKYSIYILHLMSLVMFGPIGFLLSTTVFTLWFKYGMTFAGNFVPHGIGSITNYKHPLSDNKNNGLAVNFFPVGIFMSGEEFHSNHHCNPGSARFSYRWWELDMGYIYACLLEKFGLLTIKQR